MILLDTWHEEYQQTSPSDPRPPYKFVLMSGPFTLSGMKGHLRLTFYNDRLMTTEFTPERGAEYIAALAKNSGKVPARPSEEILIGHRTKLRYDIGEDGKYTVRWSDPKLSDEWHKWVAAHG
jgi:hypothetical protein